MSLAAWLRAVAFLPIAALSCEEADPRTTVVATIGTASLTRADVEVASARSTPARTPREGLELALDATALWLDAHPTSALAPLQERLRHYARETERLPGDPDPARAAKAFHARCADSRVRHAARIDHAALADIERARGVPAL